MGEAVYHETKHSPHLFAVPGTTRQQTDKYSLVGTDANLYSPFDKCVLFAVIIERRDSHIYQIAKSLRSKNVADYDNVIQSKKKRAYTIIYNNMISANRLLCCDQLRYEGYSIFIPKSYGIIRGLPYGIGMRELMENYISDVVITQAERLLRYNKETNCSQPTQTIKLTFRGNFIPNTVTVYGIIHPVIFYIPPPLFCKNCLKYGHSTGNCRSKPNHVSSGLGNESDDEHEEIEEESSNEIHNASLLLPNLVRPSNANYVPAANEDNENEDLQPTIEIDGYTFKEFYPKNQNKHWWNAEIQRLWEDKKEAQTEFNRVKDIHTAMRLKQTTGKLKMEIKRARKKSLNELMKKFEII